MKYNNEIMIAWGFAISWLTGEVFHWAAGVAGIWIVSLTVLFKCLTTEKEGRICLKNREDFSV